MKKDQYGLWVEDEGSGGDSAHYSGLAVIAFKDQKVPLELLVTPDGYGVRHFDDGISWHANPLNFSRDQLMPLMAGLYFQGKKDVSRRLFDVQRKNWFFAQNIERDYPGTKKKPYPHWHFDLDGNRRFSWFDFRDPLMPHHIEAIWKASGMGGSWLLRPISIITFCLEAISIGLTKHNDIGAFFATAYILGPWHIALFTLFIPSYQERFMEYFSGWRNFEDLGKELGWMACLNNEQIR